MEESAFNPFLWEGYNQAVRTCQAAHKYFQIRKKTEKAGALGTGGGGSKFDQSSCWRTRNHGRPREQQQKLTFMEQ